MISLFGGTGFILGNFAKKYPLISTIEARDCISPLHQNVIYGISTVSNYEFFDDVHIDVDTNLTHLLNVLQNCKNKNITFNYISSWFVFAGCKNIPPKESDLSRPLGFYSATKLCAESLLITFCEIHNIKWRIFRLANVVGRGDKFSAKKNALQYLISEIKENRDVDLYWGGNFYRDYISADYACEAIHHLANFSKENEIYNIGSGQKFKFLDLLNFAKKELNSTSKFNTIEPKPFHKIVQVKDMWLDITKLRNTGFKTKVDIYKELGKLL